MTPFRLRLLVTAFLAIATAISVNALYFQAPPRFASGTAHPNPKRKQAEAQAKPAPRMLTTAALPVKSAQPAPPPATPAPAPAAPLAAATPVAKPEPPQRSQLVQTIQKKLARLGYKSLPQDGVINRETRAAIVAAEFEQGLPLSGEPGDAVLASLFFLEASGRSGLASADRFERDARLVREVQDLLAKLGYTSGPIDGRLDAGTRLAIKKFEADRRLPPDGRLTERTLLEMLIERGKPFLAKG
jgi:peptidoglycan hydrolase-like protein with peptidoglycan-binding domain